MPSSPCSSPTQQRTWPPFPGDGVFGSTPRTRVPDDVSLAALSLLVCGSRMELLCSVVGANGYELSGRVIYI
jgi:hypothetical protein